VGHGRQPSSDDASALWEKVHADVPPQTLLFRLGLINRLDVTGDLEKITVPCLYLQAADDRVAPGAAFAISSKTFRICG
jgi:pimeloyl-ACP methyl ester carboxylesterase